MTPLSLMPYQVQGADFLANRDRAGLHDEMGVGKTAQACHYTNIQPLWRSDNRRKGAKCL